MRTIFLISLMLFSIEDANSATGSKFTLELTKCVSVQVDLKESKEIKIFSAPIRQVVCSKNYDENKIMCSINEKKESDFHLLSNREFEVDSSIGEVSQLKTDDGLHRLFINREVKGAVFFSKEFSSQTKVKETTCSGTYADDKDKPKEKKVEKPVKPQQIKIQDEPAMIGR